jgi:hypothetical protein
LQELGLGLKNLILNHIQGYHVDASGGIIVMMDFQAYRYELSLGELRFPFFFIESFASVFSRI